MIIQESGENYLETILVLGQEGKKVRAVDIAQAMEFSKPSVSVAMKKLRQDGFVEISGSLITLTEKGKKIAERMYERHLLLSDWLISLGVDRDVAMRDACRMEHVISEEGFEAIKGSILRP